MMFLGFDDEDISASIKALAARVENGKGTLGKLFSEDDSLYANLSNTVANLKFPIKRILVPYVFAGPRLDYLMNYEEDTRVFGFYDDYAKVNRLIYGVIAGGGINVKLMRLTFGLSFDYYFNFNKPVDCTLGGTAVKISERTFAVNAKVGLRLK
ncbi:MAG TPA: outer membrane beta-barrel protein, partial [Bacteroidales bacterium]|nr:outer membrane beta-barrel protein [Bacteroidales bacterium]